MSFGTVVGCVAGRAATTVTSGCIGEVDENTCSATGWLL
jgi:hypothetical protein